MDIRVSIVTTERSPSSNACPDLSVPSTFYSLRVLRAGTGLGTAFDDADIGGQSGVEDCSAGQTSAWLSTVAFVLGVLLALAWKSGLVPDRQIGSDCPCRQQIPESQVSTVESGPPRGPRGIPVRMSGVGGIDPDSGGWNGETEQKDLAKFSMAWRCPSPSCWSVHSHTVP